MTKKYGFTGETIQLFSGRILHQIVALKDFNDVEVGRAGGWIEKEENLSQEDNAWVYDNAQVYGDARVYGDACVYGNALITDNGDICWFSNVGSEHGTLTAYKTKDNTLEITRGCFGGSLHEFEQAVEETHGNSKFAQEYKALIAYLKIRYEWENIAEDLCEVADDIEICGNGEEEDE
ncbi:TPA: hypothetical protein ACSKJX_000530 [Listeria innocua]